MKKSIKLIFAGMITWILVLSSCEKVVFPVPEIILPDTVSYSLEIQPIWNENCIQCHPPTRGLDLRVDVSYDELISGEYIDTANAPESELMKKLYGSHVSTAPTTETEKQLILKWINEGAKNN